MHMNTRILTFLQNYLKGIADGLSILRTVAYYVLLRILEMLSHTVSLESPHGMFESRLSNYVVIHM